MGKRSNFERVERDFYPTPFEAVEPLFPYVSGTFCEPCAGNGALIKHLSGMIFGMECTAAYDIEPLHLLVKQKNALELTYDDLNGADTIITNPPWDRDILHPMIERFSKIVPTWLLFDADWMHTKQSKDYMWYCTTIVSVGRVKWIPGSKMTGKDNCAWYKFEYYQEYENKPTRFIGRK